MYIVQTLTGSKFRGWELVGVCLCALAKRLGVLDGIASTALHQCVILTALGQTGYDDLVEWLC